MERKPGGTKTTPRHQRNSHQNVGKKAASYDFPRWTGGAEIKRTGSEGKTAIYVTEREWGKKRAE